MEQQYKDLSRKIKDAVERDGKFESYAKKWIFWYYLEDGKKDLFPILPELSQENQNGGGEVLEYYKSTFLNTINQIFPAINEFYRANTTD